MHLCSGDRCEKIHIQPDAAVDKSILDCAVASGFPRPPGAVNTSG